MTLPLEGGDTAAPMLDGDDVTRRIYERLHAVLGRDGWRKDLSSNESHEWRLIRENGVIRQETSFGAYMAGGLAQVLRTDRTSEIVEVEPNVQINVYMRFSSDLIDVALRKLLPEDTEALAAAYVSGGSAHFFVAPHRVFASARGLSGEWLGDTADLEAWIDRFLAWYESDGRAALDSCRDVPSLNRTLHTPWSLQQPEAISGLQAMLSTLVVVHLCDDPAVPFMDWFGAVRRAQVGSYRWQCERYAQFPGEFQAVPQQVIENGIVERLIERVRRRRAPNS